MDEKVESWLKEHDNMLSNHEIRICNVENKTEGQNDTIKELADKINTLTYAIGAGMFAIILMLIPILLNLL